MFERLVAILAAGAVVVLGVSLLPGRLPPRQVVKTHLGTVGIEHGDPSIALVIVEFGDMYCGVCKEFHRSVLPIVIERYVRTGRARFRYVEAHPDRRTRKLLDLAVCAAPDVGFYQATSWVVEAPLKEDEAVAFVRSRLSADSPSLTACADSVTRLSATGVDTAVASSLGVTGFPTFVIGALDSKGCLAGWPLKGLPPADTIASYVRDAELALGSRKRLPDIDLGCDSPI